MQELLRRHRLVEGLVGRQEMPRHDLVESLVHRQNVAELRAKLDRIHPADIAYILEALPLDERLKGVLPLSKLIVVELDDSVGKVMVRDMVTLYPDDKAQEAAKAFERYDLVSAAVVDEEGRLVGRVTIDKVVDYIREKSESEEEDVFSAKKCYNVLNKLYLYESNSYYQRFYPRSRLPFREFAILTAAPAPAPAPAQDQPRISLNKPRIGFALGLSPTG